MDRNVASSSTITTCFFLLFLFTFSSARTPFDSTDQINLNDFIDHTNHHSSISVSENNPVDDNAILLPTDINQQPKPERPEPEPEPKPQPATLIHYEPEETTDFKTEVPKPTESSNPLPFTVFRFDPSSRIPRRPLPLSFRPVHRCHHNHHYKPWNNRHFPLRGNNVITNIDVDVEDKDFDRVARGGAPRIPAGWIKFDDINEPMFSLERSMGAEKNELLRKLYHHRYHQRRQDQEPADQEDIKDNGGLVKRIRKFLNRF